MNSFLALEHVNLFIGLASDSYHLILTELQLPKISEQYIDHRPGGAPVAIEVDVMIQHLEASFVLAGVQPNAMKLLRPYQFGQTWFSFYGFVRDQMDGTYTQAVAQMQGRLGSIEPANWRRGTTFATRYSIREIMSYSLEVEGFGNIINWNFMQNQIYVG